MSVFGSILSTTEMNPGILAYLKNVNLNSANSDNAVAILYAKYVVRRVIVTNPSTSFAVSLATIGVFTATGGGGTAVVSLGTIAGLTGTTKYLDLTLALTTDVLTAATLYIRNGVAFGSAATVDVYIFGEVLP